MLIDRLKIDIENTYISKPLERETFLKVLKENPNTIHGLYLITNELKSMHHFLTLDDHPKYSINAYVVVYHGYCGKAKQQMSVIKTMQSKFKQRPFFKITYKIIEKSTQKERFSFKHNSSNKNEIYKLIDRFHNKTNELCKANTF